jgi:trigger factor
MNITRENIDDLNAILKVKVEKTDYEANVEKVLRDYRRKSNIKGFRPGMVPFAMVKKMYGKAVQLDEINKLVSENVQKYFTDEKLDILGDPLPKNDENEKNDFDAQEDFIFTFEIGLAPQFEINLNKKNKVNYYEITVDEKMKNDHVENYTRRYGEFRKAEVSEENDMLTGKIEATDGNGNVLPEGPSEEDATLSIAVIKDDEIKKMFTGKSENDLIEFDIRKALPNDSEIAGLLHRKKDEVTSVNGIFRFIIKEISHFHPAEIGKELFDKIYGENIVSTGEEFMKKIEEEIETSLKHESEFKLMADIKKLASEKTEFNLPEDFLKRWLLKVNENATSEQIEKDFDSFRKDLKWQLIKNKIARENEIKITEEELLKEAENITKFQFRQYGLFYATDEQVTKYARETLKREDDVKRIADKLLDDKVIELIKDMVKQENKKISIEEFNKLFE